MMDMGKFTLFLKTVKEEYALNDEQLMMLRNRLLADDSEFERVSKLFRSRARGSVGGKDHFGQVLSELLS
jgi:hypothetical protein